MADDNTELSFTSEGAIDVTSGAQSDAKDTSGGSFMGDMLSLPVDAARAAYSGIVKLPFETLDLLKSGGEYVGDAWTDFLFGEDFTQGAKRLAESSPIAPSFAKPSGSYTAPIQGALDTVLGKPTNPTFASGVEYLSGMVGPGGIEKGGTALLKNIKNAPTYLNKIQQLASPLMRGLTMAGVHEGGQAAGLPTWAQIPLDILTAHGSPSAVRDKAMGTKSAAEDIVSGKATTASPLEKKTLDRFVALAAHDAGVDAPTAKKILEGVTGRPYVEGLENTGTLFKEGAEKLRSKGVDVSNQHPNLSTLATEAESRGSGVSTPTVIKEQVGGSFETKGKYNASESGEKVRDVLVKRKERGRIEGESGYSGVKPAHVEVDDKAVKNAIRAAEKYTGEGQSVQSSADLKSLIGEFSKMRNASKVYNKAGDVIGYKAVPTKAQTIKDLWKLSNKVIASKTPVISTAGLKVKEWLRKTLPRETVDQLDAASTKYAKYKNVHAKDVLLKIEKKQKEAKGTYKLPASKIIGTPKTVEEVRHIKEAAGPGGWKSIRKEMLKAHRDKAISIIDKESDIINKGNTFSKYLKDNQGVLSEVMGDSSYGRLKLVSDKIRGLAKQKAETFGSGARELTKESKGAMTGKIVAYLTGGRLGALSHPFTVGGTRRLVSWIMENKTNKIYDVLMDLASDPEYFSKLNKLPVKARDATLAKRVLKSAIKTGAITESESTAFRQKINKRWKDANKLSAKVVGDDVDFSFESDDSKKKMTNSKYDQILKKETAKESQIVTPKFLAAVMHQESRGEPGAVSPKGATGLMQVMPATAKWLSQKTGRKYDLKKPEDSIAAGADYFRYLEGRFHDHDLVLAAYNAGEGNIRKWMKRYKTTKWKEIAKNLQANNSFKETIDYVKEINKRLGK